MVLGPGWECAEKSCWQTGSQGAGGPDQWGECDMGVPSQSHLTWLGLPCRPWSWGLGDGWVKSHLRTVGGDIWQITILVTASRVKQANLRPPMGVLGGPPLLPAACRPWAAEREIYLGVGSPRHSPPPNPEARSCSKCFPGTYACKPHSNPVQGGISYPHFTGKD